MCCVLPPSCVYDINKLNPGIWTFLSLRNVPRSTAQHSYDSLNLTLTLSFDFTDWPSPYLLTCANQLALHISVNTQVKTGPQLKPRSFPTRPTIPSIPDRFIWKPWVKHPNKVIEAFIWAIFKLSDILKLFRSKFTLAENGVLALCLQPPDRCSQSQLPSATYT